MALAPGADDNPLARWVHDTVARRVSHAASDGKGRRSLLAMRATVVLTAPDRRFTATLRFDHGSVAVHDGAIGVPDVTFCGDYAALTAIATMPMSRWARLPVGASWRRLAGDVVAGDLKIYGLASHPRLVLRVLRLLSSDA